MNIVNFHELELDLLLDILLAGEPIANYHFFLLFNSILF